MNASYKNWKENLEAEFEEHRNQNTKLIYRYQDGYDYYVNSPEWVMVGDFCNFVRRSALHKHEEINARYKKELLNNINIFRGFCQDEFERIRVCHRGSNFEEYAKKIFEYSGMKLRYDDLTTNQRWEFKKELKKYLEANEETIELFKKFEEFKESR